MQSQTNKKDSLILSLYNRITNTIYSAGNYAVDFVKSPTNITFLLIFIASVLFGPYLKLIMPFDDKGTRALQLGLAMLATPPIRAVVIDTPKIIADTTYPFLNASNSLIASMIAAIAAAVYTLPVPVTGADSFRITNLLVQTMANIKKYGSNSRDAIASNMDWIIDNLGLGLSRITEPPAKIVRDFLANMIPSFFSEENLTLFFKRQSVRVENVRDFYTETSITKWFGETFDAFTRYFFRAKNTDTGAYNPTREFYNWTQKQSSAQYGPNMLYEPKFNKPRIFGEPPPLNGVEEFYNWTQKRSSAQFDPQKSYNWAQKQSSAQFNPNILVESSTEIPLSSKTDTGFIDTLFEYAKDIRQRASAWFTTALDKFPATRDFFNENTKTIGYIFGMIAAAIILYYLIKLYATKKVGASPKNINVNILKNYREFYAINEIVNDYIEKQYNYIYNDRGEREILMSNVQKASRIIIILKSMEQDTYVEKMIGIFSRLRVQQDIANYVATYMKSIAEINETTSEKVNDIILTGEAGMMDKTSDVVGRTMANFTMFSMLKEKLSGMKKVTV